MAPHDTEPPSRTPMGPAPGARPSHHLASVAHHFFSESSVSSPAPGPRPPIIVVQAGPPAAAKMVHERLRSSLGEDPSRALHLAVLDDLEVFENLREFPADFLPRGAVVVWGTGRAAARSLLAVRDLGRWIRRLEPAFLEIVVLDTDASDAEEERGLLRSRAERIARGIPVRVICRPAEELDAVLAETAGTDRTECSP